MKCEILSCGKEHDNLHICDDCCQKCINQGGDLSEWIEQQNEAQPTPKKNQGKPRMGLLRWGFLTAIAEALTFGATKYPEENYLNLPSEQLFESMLRHISELRQGRTHDEESGLHHAKHVAANCMMWFETMNKEGKL